jgi:hypothetical protein
VSTAPEVEPKCLPTPFGRSYSCDKTSHNLRCLFYLSCFIDVVGANGPCSTLSKFVGLRNVYCIFDCIVRVNCVLLDRLY